MKVMRDTLFIGRVSNAVCNTDYHNSCEGQDIVNLHPSKTKAMRNIWMGRHKENKQNL